MPIEQIVSNRHKFLIPLRIVSFVSADQKQSGAARVKCKEDAQVSVAHFSP